MSWLIRNLEWIYILCCPETAPKGMTQRLKENEKVVIVVGCYRWGRAL